MSPEMEETSRILNAARRMHNRIESMTFLSGDVSQRRYARLYTEAGTRIACCYPDRFDTDETASERFRRLHTEDPLNHLTWASDPVAYIESTEWFSRIGIRVPEIYAVFGDLGIIVLQDIGDISLQSFKHSASFREIESHYLTAISYIDILQDSTEDVSRYDTLAGILILDIEKLASELELLIRGMNTYLPAVLQEIEEGTLRAEWRILTEHAAPKQPVLCHRDYHARNLYIQGNSLFVIDHQDFRLGHSGYDYASLLYDPYVSLSYSQRNHLLNIHGSDSREKFAPVVVQRLLKAIGTYITEVNTGRNTEFYRSIITATGVIRRLLDDRLVENMPRTRYLIEAVHNKAARKMSG